MKKTFLFTCISVLTLGAVVSCGSNDKYISEAKAKEIAYDEFGCLEPEEFTDCELVDVGWENKVYKLGGSDGVMAYLSLMVDAKTGDIIHCESESLWSGNHGYEKEHLSLDEVKDIIYTEIPGTSELNIFYCFFDIDDDDSEHKPFYYASVFTLDGIYDLTISGLNGEVVENDFKADDYEEELVQGFKEEFREYLPENRFTSPDGRRPVWLLAHHCNDNHYKDGQMKPGDERDAYKGIESGCNGVEIDLSHRASDNQIILRHMPEVVAHAETLNQFLELPEVHDDRMTMVLYDIKDYDYINQIISVTHDFYKQKENQDIYIIYSINELKKLKVDENDDPYKRFRDVVDVLWPNEALAIDYENDQNRVQSMFEDIKFTRGIFANGIFSGRARGNIENSCKAAVQIRDTGTSPYRFCAVESWTVGRLHNKNFFFYESVGLAERINWGCDIVLLDGFKGLDYLTYDTFYARDLFKENPNLYLADKSVNPWTLHR